MTGELVAGDVARAEEAVARARAKVAHSLVALRDEATRSVDWREWIRRRPHESVALAFALGFLLARHCE